MTDDEVKAWLNDEERADFVALNNWSGLDDCPSSLGVYQSLAETRKALADMHTSVLFLFDAYVNADDHGAPLSPSRDGVLSVEGAAACDFASTMPRPKA